MRGLASICLAAGLIMAPLGYTLSPVLLDLVGVEADSVYGTYPFRASSEDQLVEVIRRVAESREQAFVQAWQAVGPGMIPSLQQIAALAAASGKQRG